MEQSLYKVSSTMKKLDVCCATIYRLIDRGKLEKVKIGSTTHITEPALIALSPARVRTDRVSCVRFRLRLSHPQFVAGIVARPKSDHKEIIETCMNTSF